MKKAFVTIFIVCVCILLSVVVYCKPSLFDQMCLATRPTNIWQYFSGCFIHVIEPRFAFWIQLVMNLMGLIPMGYIIEKRYGSLKIFSLFLVEIIVTAILFQIVTWRNPGTAAGISSVMYAFGTVGFYCLYNEMREKKKEFWKQVSSYYFAFIGIGMLTNIAPMGSFVSMALHGSGIVCGGVFVALNKKWKADFGVDKEKETM